MTQPAEAEQWRRSLEGDRDAFQALVAPHLAELLAAAGHELAYRQAVGDLTADDLAPEELVAETLARAWRDRHRRPPLLGIRPWLLGLQFRVAERIVRQEARARELAALSLEAPVPPGPIYDDEESFWEWYQPDERLRTEDVIADPRTNESAPAEEDAAPLPATEALPPMTRWVFILHRRHRLAIEQTAAALGIGIREATDRLAEAQKLIARK